MAPPEAFSIVKGALDSEGPVLKRKYGEEEISVYVTRLLSGMDDESGGIDQLFVHVDVSKAGQEESLILLCGLYEDALGIHSVSMRPKDPNTGYIVLPTQYVGPNFE